MYSRLTASPPELRKWCVYALVLLVPGSFVVLPALWFARLMSSAKSAPGEG
jgi:hypothetical protein